MHKIEMFKIYKPKRNLKEGIEIFAKRPCELLITLVDLKDEVIFGTLCQNPGRAYLFSAFKEPYYKIHLDRFYKISKINLARHINLYKYNKKPLSLPTDKQVKILQRMQKIFENRNSKFSLTYIYKKNQKPRLFF